MAFIKTGAPEDTNILEFCQACGEPLTECVCEKSKVKTKKSKSGDKHVRQISSIGRKLSN